MHGRNGETSPDEPLPDDDPNDDADEPDEEELELPLELPSAEA